jgi:hypothetical protein
MVSLRPTGFATDCYRPLLSASLVAAAVSLGYTWAATVIRWVIQARPHNVVAIGSAADICARMKADPHGFAQLTDRKHR